MLAVTGSLRGLAYIVFLPLIGISAILLMAGRKLAAVLRLWLKSKVAW
ncbi:MAG: hypothetical protein V1780_05640 [Chloroflexota bacterium]